MRIQKFVSFAVGRSFLATQEASRGGGFPAYRCYSRLLFTCMGGHGSSI